MTPGKIMRTERQQATAERLGNLAVIVMRKIWANPGLAATELPVNQRGQLRRLEQEGAIEYRDGGWYER